MVSCSRSFSSCSGEDVKMVVGPNQVGALRHVCIYIENNQMRELTCLEGTNYKMDEIHTAKKESKNMQKGRNGEREREFNLKDWTASIFIEQMPCFRHCLKYFICIY